MATGILSAIGSIHAFKSHDALAKYAGLVWRENQSAISRLMTQLSQKQEMPISGIVCLRQSAM